MREIEFSIPIATPSNNVIMRMHHRVRSATHLQYKQFVRYAIGNNLANPFTSCVVTVTRHGSRMLDWDNMGGGLKFLLDAMVKNNVILDDNPSCINYLELRQEKVPKKQEQTIVRVQSG